MTNDGIRRNDEARMTKPMDIKSRAFRHSAIVVPISAKLPAKHDRGDDETDAGDDLADAPLGDALRVVCAEEITGHRAQGYRQGFGPINQAGENEIDAGDLVDSRAENRLERVHLVNIGQAQVAERGQHENADPGSEITAVNRHQKLEQNRRPNGATMRRRGDV